MGPEDYLESILHHGQTAAAQSLGDERSSQLNSLVWKRYYVLKPTAPHFNAQVSRGLFVLAVPLLALYQSLREDFDLEQMPALTLAEKMLRDMYAIRFGPLTRGALNAMYHLRPVRRLLQAKMQNAHDDPEGFRFENIDEPTTLLAFDVHACPIASFAKMHGAAEVVPIICRVDDLIAEQLIGIEFRRSGTIGMGADRCDFRYVRKK